MIVIEALKTITLLDGLVVVETLMTVIVSEATPS
jgi:hypothetical protein